LRKVSPVTLEVLRPAVRRGSRTLPQSSHQFAVDGLQCDYGGLQPGALIGRQVRDSPSSPRDRTQPAALLLQVGPVEILRVDVLNGALG
jgi:hypothetical protein